MSHDEFTPVPDEDDGWVSKTQLKQQADALHDVGKTLGIQERSCRKGIECHPGFELAEV